MRLGVLTGAARKQILMKKAPEKPSRTQELEDFIPPVFFIHAVIHKVRLFHGTWQAECLN
jgi:hypothetical protein